MSDIVIMSKFTCNRLQIKISITISIRVAASHTCLLQVSDADDVRPVLQRFGEEGIGHAQDDRRPAGREGRSSTTPPKTKLRRIFTISRRALARRWQRATEEFSSAAEGFELRMERKQEAAIVWLTARVSWWCTP